jgi:diguanylate cyclase (GGDEF)-like protein
VAGRTLARLTARFVPEVPIVAALLALLRWAPRPTLAAFADFYPLAVLAAGLWLGWRFHRSRLVFALLVLTLAQWALHAFPLPLSLKTAAPTTHTVIFQAAMFLLPLNLAAIAIGAERGFLTPAGLLRLGALALQVALVAAFALHTPASAGAVLDTTFLPGAWFSWTRLGQPALAAFVVAAAVLAVFLFFAPGASSRAFLWAIVVAFLALRTGRLGPGQTVELATAGLILVVAVIEGSFTMAYQDGLTGLPGRRALTEALQRVSGRYAVAMVDVDHFKKFNDTYGHDVGDQVLRMVAARLAAVRAGGQGFRYGGEEFALIFPGKTAAECHPVLDELRKVVEDTHFTLRGRLRPRKKPDAPKSGGKRRQLHVTISIGVADGEGDADKVLRAADRALYRAKENGRNRVER